MRFKKCASILLSAIIALGICAINPNDSQAATKAEFLSGSNRYKTAIEVSKKGWDYADNVILVNNSAIADALAATPLADELNAPILLTEKNTLNTETKAEISRLGAKNIYLIGGESVLSESLSSEIDGNVYRISGNSREKTALEIAKKIQELKPIKTIAVVNGKTGLADAVSIAAVAAEKDMAIILSNAKSGSQDSAQFLNSIGIEKSYVIGGNKSVSNSIMATLPNAERISGLNRNDTNAAVIKKFYTDPNLNNLYVAKNGSGNENNLIDALAVGVLAAKNNSPVLIVSNKLSTSQHDVVKSKDINIVTRVGGNGNESAFEEVKELQGIKSSELKLPSSVLGDWFVEYKGIASDSIEENDYYSYGEGITIYEDYIDEGHSPVKYTVTNIIGNEYYVDLFFHHELGDGWQKHKFVIGENTLVDYIYKNGNFVKNYKYYKDLDLPSYALRNYYRDNDISMTIDNNYITILGYRYKYEVTDLYYPTRKDFIIKTIDHNPPLYFYINQWGNKVHISFITVEDYNSDKPKTPLATFSTSPMSTEILGDVLNIPPGSVMIY